ncbi:winged helix-turn-helix domain-containing protein [Streptomyces sioyaensis]|uniref:winged helix-turn-helix domain-containing protein n=1 Tax=Streptomyces sioyaensis TaxID=67364 RepID=UPI0037D0A7B1
MLPAISAQQQHRTQHHSTQPAWLSHFPRLSSRAARLLTNGDTDNRYTGRNDSDTGYRTTMALAVACSQPGRAWTPADLYEVLVHRPTPAGAWARSLRSRKGTDYTTAKLADMLARARDFVGRKPTIEYRTDAMLELARLRDVVESHPWRGRTGGTDQKNLTARLRLAELAGGFDHTVSVRHLAELMGCAKSTAVSSNQRLIALGYLKLLQAGKNTEASMWQLSLPTDSDSTQDSHASPAHPPAARQRGAVSVPETRRLAMLMAHDAFHAWAHGTSGARILCSLDATDGASVRQLALATGLHPSTVRRRLIALTKDGLALEADGLYYLSAPTQGGEQGQLLVVAELRGTAGYGVKRRQRHLRERAQYAAWRAHRAQRRVGDRPRLRLVPEGIIDAATGEFTDDRWEGWDISDPTRPTWIEPSLAHDVFAA